MIKRFLHFSGSLYAGVLLVFSVSAALAQIDADATEKTRILYSNLKQIQNSSSFLFGQEFFNSFRYSSGSAHGDMEYSDSKAVTGAHPALLGSDFHYYLEKSDDERSYHTEAVKWAYRQGYVITFDWHISARGTNSYESGSAPPNLVNNIVAGLNGDRDWFLGELDKVIAIINEDLVVDGDAIPIVFRPFHEMNGGWFWWGSSSTTAANYKALYALTVDYVKERTRSVLFCWAPNTPMNFSYYPGDEYVDVLGLDAYEITASGLRNEIEPIIDHAQEKDKVAVLSETGNRVNGDDATTYWKDTVLPAIMDDPGGKSRKIAWVLTWINASWSYPYVPHAASSQAAKESFIDFKNSPNVLFGDEITNLYAPIPEIPVGVEDGVKGRSGNVTLYYTPSGNGVTIVLNDFGKPSRISVYDITGKRISEMRTMADEHTLSLNNMKAGVYVLLVSDHNKTVSKKLMIGTSSSVIGF